MTQDNSDSEETPAHTDTSAEELAALGTSFAASSPGSLAGGPFGSPGGPAAGAVLLGLLKSEDEILDEVNPPGGHEKND